MSTLTATGPITYSSGTTSIGITQATSSTGGYLSNADWNTFNNKLSAETDTQVGANATNYLPKWNGSALVASKSYDDGYALGTDLNRFTWTSPAAGNGKTRGSAGGIRCLG